MTIPANEIVSIVPSVLEAGGRALDIIAVMVTDSSRIPIGTVPTFADQIDVASYFGSGSTEAALATIYFNGFDNSNIRPASLKAAQYPVADVPAWLRGGTLSGMTLAQLKALAAGTLTIVVNGVSIVAASVDLSAVTSFTNAATVIQAAFTATQATAATATIAGTTLTLNGAITGDWELGMLLAGPGVPANTYILELLTGTLGAAGSTYLLSTTSTVGVGVAMTGAIVPQVTFDSVSSAFRLATYLSGAGQTIGYAATNTLASALKLTSATGALISQGAAGDPDPTVFMDGIKAVTTNWATFFLTFDPDAAEANTVKYEFCQWVNAQSDRYAFACWDTDDAPSTTVPATQSLGYLLQQGNFTGTCLIGSDVTNTVTASYAAFVCGYAASLDFTQTNGRATLAFRMQTGLLATCVDATSASNLMENGYNFYGAYSTANETDIFMYDGQVSGPFLWMDSYINQIWMNNKFQRAFMDLLIAMKSIPYNRAGYSLIEAAALDTIFAAVNFGAIRAGVTLSQAQAAAVNNAAGVIISNTLNQRGWYFQVLDASPEVRQARGSPPCTFWYMDGGSVQKINVSSVELV